MKYIVSSATLMVLAGVLIFFFYHPHTHPVAAKTMMRTPSSSIGAPESPSSPMPTPIPSHTPSSAGLAMVSLNFDDGFLSAYTHAIPILNRAGLKSSQYIITHAFTNKSYVTPADVLAMQAAGHEIGAHSQTHPHLTQLDPQQEQTEIIGSRNDLLALGVHSVTTFVYPYGDFNAATEGMVRDAGFMAARSIIPGLNNPSTDRYALLSYSVQASTSLPQVQQWIDTALTQKQWLILVFHRVDEDGNPISVRHELVQQIVDYLVQKKVPVVTTRQGLELLSRASMIRS